MYREVESLCCTSETIVTCVSIICKLNNFEKMILLMDTCLTEVRQSVTRPSCFSFYAIKLIVFFLVYLVPCFKHFCALGGNFTL